MTPRRVNTRRYCFLPVRKRTSTLARVKEGKIHFQATKTRSYSRQHRSIFEVKVSLSMQVALLEIVAVTVFVG
ncbi:hypothetical protein CEXT_425651 [Caerostris extrusa]|uniref:Uncharacterized protein n=1 Tax=Caerostris extrusa TaxID=172846 RepID=A0AAV4XV86_CAEEX|nr:hypothetical protein CEXT_425651 [Caerostris extrusa]